MYVTYNTTQYSDVENWYSEIQYGLFRFARPPQRFSTLPKPQFMPSKLLRVSDMCVVQGSTVNEGYCALSYSWNWSGDIIMDEATRKTKRVDHGKHKIIFPAKRAPRKPRGRNRTPRRVKFVEFEGIIQQICKDFNVKYIWYDQWCINQNDKEEKLREIRQMHKIYRNAHCTVALVPEFCSRRSSETRIMNRQPNYPKIFTSQWMRRVWTLEEALLSPRILFVGRDIHSWGHMVQRVANLHALCQKLPDLNASTVLYYAHIRTTTKEHDRVFALANLFPDIMESITISYEEPINDLLLHFYRLLAQKDISILCFGQHADYKRIGRPKEELAQASDVSLILKEYFSGYEFWHDYPYSVPIQTHDKLLPSWTGVHGEHILPLRTEYNDYPKTTFRNYTVTGNIMQVTSSYISTMEVVRRRWFIPLQRREDFPPEPRGPSYDVNGKLGRWNLCISVQFPGQEISKTLILPLSIHYWHSVHDLPKFDQMLHRALWFVAQFMPVKRENLFWWNAAWPQDSARLESFLLTENVFLGSDLVILSGVRFKDNWPDWKRCPVLIKDEGAEHYRAIGTCRIARISYFLSGVNLPEKTFTIK